MQVTENLSKSFDVVVVGGGMVGAAVALGLSQQGFNVALLERQQPDLSWSENQPFQTRVSALTRASENLLRALGVWQGIEARRLHAFTDMHVCEKGSAAQVHFAASDIAEENLGYVIENQVIQAALWEQILASDAIEVILGDALQGFEKISMGMSVQLASGRQLQASLLVGADGAHSQVRQLASIGLDTHDYEQCAVVGCVKTEASHQDTCWQKYNETGPFAYLAMEDNVSSIAWYLPLEKMNWALNLDDVAFAEALNEASGLMLGRVIEVAERGAFPLVRRHAQHYVKPHLVLVGDAAHTIHPQAGQGVNLGLLDAAALIDVLVEAKAVDTNNWSRLAVLRRYERWRRGDNALVQRSMEVFDELFKPQSGLRADVRQLGLSLADRFSLGKNWLMEQALNGRGEMPKLTQSSIK